MTTREEYAEAAAHAESLAMLREGHFADMHKLAARVLRALADGAVLCDGRPMTSHAQFGDGQIIEMVLYRPLDQQP